MMLKHTSLVLAIVGALVFVSGCNKQPSTSSKTAHTHNGHSHDHGDASHDHDHEPAPAPANKDHDMIPLGTATVDGFTVRASRDKGEIKPGGDAPIDVWVDHSTAKVIAVRIWIGTKDGATSVKARAEIENSSEPNHWHTHAEVPNPIPADGKLWVEIESDSGQRTTTSFDLQP